MATIMLIGVLIALGVWAHKVGVPAVIKKLEEVAQRGEAAAEKLVSEVRAQTAQLNAPSIKPAPIAPGATAPKA